MKFERLRLLGFKSFCEPTDFLIEPGLTGVVGPNGCGKSNLVEALRWVMGENSYKNMRASGMDDVIFSGGGSRPARNLAEVGLVLDNSSRTAPAAFNDADAIEVTRRIEREQGSTYRINGREVRARDVQLAVRRRLHRRALALARAPGPDRRDHFGQAAGAPPHSRRRRRRRRPAFAPPRGRAAPQRRVGKSHAPRRRAEAGRQPGRQPEAPGAPGARAIAGSRRKSARTRRWRRFSRYQLAAQQLQRRRRRSSKPDGAASQERTLEQAEAAKRAGDRRA